MDTTKIIKGVVNSGRYTVTAPIVKENYGIYLQIEGAELPETYQVDFSNDEHHGTSVTMIGNSDGVRIPHQFIDTGKDIFAFLYHVGADYGRTVYKFRIPNKVRPDRTNETPTPEEQSTIDQAISALNTAVEQTAQDVIDADTSAQSASADAERAEEARTDAQNYANNAQASATSASQSATASANSASASAQSASQSAQIKSDVESLADDAQASADASAQSASASANSAIQASLSESEAERAKGNAQTYASQAQTSAQTASGKAQDASQSASTASQKATESAQSASQALTYKTDAESAKTASQTAQGLAESARDSAISAKEDAESARDEAQTLVDGISGKVEQIDSNTERIESLEDDRYKPYVTDTVSGSIASFPDGADDIPLKSLIVNIDPVQDLSNGDPSPENICPISGWTGMQLSVNGTVIPISWQSEAGTVYGGKLDVLSGVLTVDRAKIDLSTLSGWANNMNGDKGIEIKCTLNGKKEGRTNIISDKLLTGTEKSATNTAVYSVRGFPTSSLIAVKVPTAVVTDPNGLLAWIGENKPSVCYELATPITYQLTPQQVNSLLGQNNIFADTGDTTCEYRADTKLYIERLTAPDSTDMIADSNIVSGQYFMVGNSLYKATANIANGGQIIVGTNATRVSLAQALNEINA